MRSCAALPARRLSVRSADVPGFGQDRKVRHASVGAAGQALSDIRAFSSHPAFSLTAVADVDRARTEQVKKLFPDVRVYQDWREMFRKEAGEHRLGQRLDAGSHARADRDVGDGDGQGRSTCRSRWR